MLLTRDIRNILKPAFAGLAFLSLFSASFVITYAFFDHQSYLRAYQASQAREVSVANKKAEAVFEDLRKLLGFTGARILASYESFHKNPRVDLQRIQRVLSSVYLQAQFDQTLLALQAVSYAKLSSPRLMVSRLSILPLDANNVGLKEMPSAANKKTLREPLEQPLFVFGDKTVRGTSAILNPQGFLEGVLEIQFDFDALKKILGTCKV